MTATDQRPGLITAPGVYDIPADLYHSDPVAGGSLSSSGIKKLLAPGCPAIFKHWREHGGEHKPAFDFGRAAHREVLGVGDDVVIIDADDYKSKAAREQRDEAYAAGLTPVLPHEDAQIKAMAIELRRHPMAAALLDPAAGEPERTLVWQDPESGVWCRLMTDFLRRPVFGQRLLVVDYKTAAEVDPESIQKAVANYCYYGQGAWYCEGVEALGMSSGAAAFILVFQRKTAPHLVTCVQLHPDDIGRGHDRNRKARDLYRHCVERDEWPGYADDRVLPIQLPTYAQYRHDGAFQRGEFAPEGKSL